MEFSVQQKFDSFYQIAQEKLQAILYSIPGPYKQLIIDPTLIRPLELICGVSWLRSKGINKIYKFDEKTIPVTNLENYQNQQQPTTFIYFISCDILLFKKIIKQIRQITELQQQQQQQQQQRPNHLNDMFIEKDFHIISVPTVLTGIEQLIEREGVYGLVQLHRFNWDFLSLDTGVVSLEIPQLFQEIFINLDTSLLSSIAHSFHIFNMVFGKTNLIITLGEYSEKMLQIVDRIEETSSLNNLDKKSDQINGDFNMICVIDRNCDYPSCLLTPVIYAGMLLEIYPSKCGRLEIDTNSNLIKKNQLSVLAVTTATPSTQTNQQSIVGGDNNNLSHLILNSQRDNLYKENRYKHVSEVLTTFGTQAKLFGVEKSRLKNMQLNEMKDFVEKNLPKISTQKKELLKHLLLCETIINELGGQFERIHGIEQTILINQNRKQSIQLIQEQLAINPNKLMSIKQICLLYVCCSLSNDDAKLFVINYLNAFGHRYLNIFSNLSRANLFYDCFGILTNQSTSSPSPSPSSSSLSAASTVTANLLNLKKQINIQKYQTKIEIGVNKFKSRQLFQTSTTGGGGGAGGGSETIGQNSSYVFSDLYNPLIAQLLTIILKSKKFDEFATASTILSAAAATTATTSSSSSSSSSFGLKFFKYLNLSQQSIQQIGTAIENKTAVDIFPFTNSNNLNIFLFIIGGVTHAEIAACQLIGQLTNTTIIIGSNCITSSNDIIQAAF